MKKKILKMLTATIMAGTLIILPLKPQVVHAESNFLYWKVQSDTVLHQTDKNWTFAVGDYNGDGVQDLYALYRSGSNSSGKVLLHVLNGADNYKSYLVQKQLPLGLDENWEFDLSDYTKDGKPDLYCILKSSNSKKATEVHVLSRSSNYKDFVVHNTIPLNKTNKNWTFKVADGDHDGRADLYGIQTGGTGSGKTEVHALSASSNFQTFFIHKATAFSPLGSNWDFGLGDFNGDNVIDLYGVCKNGTGSGKTEIHIISGKDNFNNFILQSPTLLQTVGNDTFKMLIGPGRLNIYGVQRNGSQSKKTELHVMGCNDFNKVNPLDQKRQAVVTEAKKYLGVPYVWGGTTPSGFDCSGLVQYVYSHALGINLTRTTHTQINDGIAVSESDLQPGDLVFPHENHVQIYIGNGKVIHAPHTGDVVKISNLGKVWRARRIIC